MAAKPSAIDTAELDRGATRGGLRDAGGVAVAALRPAPRHGALLPAVQGAARRRVGAGVGGPGQHGRAHGVRVPPRRRRPPRHQPLPQRRPRRRRPRARRPRPPRTLHPGVGGEAVKDDPSEEGKKGPQIAESRVTLLCNLPVPDSLHHAGDALKKYAAAATTTTPTSKL